MGERIRHVLSALLAALGLSVGVGAGAATISFQATDLPDVVAGEDLWKYSFTVAGSFVAFGGFEVIFSPSLYRSLEIPLPPPPDPLDWLVDITEPDAVLPADGLYRATALSDTPSLADPFMVSFIWLGSGSPGAQSFNVFDDTFNPTGGGRTQSASTQIPVPGTAALMGLGLLVLGARGKPGSRPLV